LKPSAFFSGLFALSLLIPNVTAASAAAPRPAGASLAGKIVAIDPGHGGVDPGTVDFGLQEKDVTLAIALALKPMLEGAGAKTVYTRTSDKSVAPPGSTERTELQARCDLANSAGANIFISIHANESGNPGYSGVTTYYGSASGYYYGATRTQDQVTASAQLAQLVDRDVAAATGETDQGVDDAPFYVLGYTNMPSILVETGFLSNRNEASELTSGSFQQRVATGIFQGVADFFAGAGANLKPPPPRTSAPPAGAQFIQDVTFPDNAPVYVGQTFTKEWRVKNNGGAAWPKGTVLAFVKGDQLGAPPAVPLPSAPPGDSVNLKVQLTAPQSPRPIAGYWQLQDGSGNAFGDPLWFRLTVVQSGPTQRSSPASNPAVKFFDVTGHNVAPPFLDFFNKQGGLDVFGYPRTEALQENGLTVQYFQRARFELHPEAPPPFNVQLTLLGDILTVSRRPFPQVQPFPPTADHVYFPQTGHSLSFGFLKFFNSHGGLQSFGYPISEELQESNNDGSGRVYNVQYFQRARFEYHPEFAGTQYEVELGLLGDQEIQAKGWVLP
jgi:N-acetylmuramoyl-L-alanine amidase